MKLKNRRPPFFPAQLILGIALIGFLVSACSLTGTQTNNTSTGVTPTSTSRSHPVASQPTATGNLPPGTQVPENEVKPLTFNLTYNDTAMEQDIAQMYTPGSPAFHQFLTPDQVVQRYALSGAQQQQVVDWLTQHGYSLDSTDSLHTSVKVHATVATIERTLNIKLKSFTINGHTFFMQEGTPTLPQPIGALVSSVVGLDNFAFPQFKPPFGLLAHAGSLAGNCSSYGAKGNLTRNKLAGAYQVNQLYQQGFQGQGMTIGVAEFGDTYNPQDLANYAACAGIATPQVQNIDVDGHLASGSGQGEAILDLELIAGLAPQAQILDYQTDGQSTSFAQSMVDVFNRVAADHKVQVLSVSYGTYESSFSTSELAAVNQSLRTLAAEGISVFISSGDCGAFTQRLRDIAAVSFPASAIYAIAVGGTHLQVNASNTRTSETVWGPGDDLPVCASNDWGSGGGVSQNSAFKLPSWQVGPGTTTHYDGSLAHVFTRPLGFDSPVIAPNGLRQVPDLAAAAYPNISIYYKGAWVNSGGTSAAAPIVAAGTLLVDQALQRQGKTMVGGVPEFYTVANHPGSRHPYTDITTGDNLFYNATVGWDYTTGWGTPNFNDILQIELGH